MGKPNVNVIIGANKQADVIYKKIILKGNVDLASQLTESGRIYVIMYAFKLDGEVVVPDNCVLDFDGGSISGGSLVLNNTTIEGIPVFDDVDISGTCANNTVYQSWFKDNDIDQWHRFINNVDGPITYEYEPGEYLSREKVSKGVDSLIEINGNGAVINTDVEVGDRWYYIVFPSDTSITVTHMTANVTSGSEGFDVESADGFSVGDTVCLHDHNKSSYCIARDYQEGEYGVITSISGTHITLDHELYGNYKPVKRDAQTYDTSCTVAKFAVCDIRIKDLTLNNLAPTRTSTNNGPRGLRLQRAKLSLDNVVSKNFIYCFYILNCVGGSINNCKGLPDPTNIKPSDDDRYGLDIVCCEHLTIDGGEYSGSHGMIVGSFMSDLSVVNRFITAQNTKTYSYLPNNASLDSHGGCEYISFLNNYCEGIALRGDHLIATGNFIENNIQCYELRGFSITFRDNTIGGNISIQFNEDPFYDYDRAIDNWTPRTDKEFVHIENNTLNAFLYQMRTSPEIYPNSANVVIDINNNYIRNGFDIRSTPDKKGDIPSSFEGLMLGATIKIRNNVFIVKWGFSAIRGAYVTIESNIITSETLLNLIAKDISILSNNFVNSTDAFCQINNTSHAVGGVDKTFTIEHPVVKIEGNNIEGVPEAGFGLGVVCNYVGNGDLSFAGTTIVHRNRYVNGRNVVYTDVLNETTNTTTRQMTFWRGVLVRVYNKGTAIMTSNQADCSDALLTESVDNLVYGDNMSINAASMGNILKPTWVMLNPPRVPGSQTVYDVDIAGLPKLVSVPAVDSTHSVSELELNVDRYYNIYGVADTLEVTLPEIPDTVYAHCIMLNMETGSSPAFTITSADGASVEYMSGYSIEANTKYELNIISNGDKWFVAYGTVA